VKKYAVKEKQCAFKVKCQPFYLKITDFKAIIFALKKKIFIK
jgi:hypothetical protein